MTIEINNVKIGITTDNIEITYDIQDKNYVKARLFTNYKVKVEKKNEFDDDKYRA
jgi:hypothetical protein